MEDKAQVQEAIKIQGEVVRKLKAEKASKEQVSMRGCGRLYPGWFVHAVSSMSSFTMTGT